MPQFSPATVILLLAALLGGAWAVGLLRLRYDDGRLSVHVGRRARLLAAFAVRDTWLLLSLSIVMGWAVASAVEHSAWVPDTDGRLVPALAWAAIVGWIFAAAGLSRLAYLAGSPVATAVLLTWLAPSPLGNGGSLAAMQRWLLELPRQTNLLLLLGLQLMFLTSGLWSSWWIFRRRNGLVALLPTGTVLAVEIVNDTSLVNTVFTVIWVATAAFLLLRLNYVGLKESWRTRRVPHAADTAWTFGEVGVEATVLILVVAFFIIPPLSTADISATLIPGTAHGDPFHPFGIGKGGSRPGGIASIGYSEVVRPGAQLQVKSEVVMVVSGDTPTYYPYWRGIALAGWDGITWYKLPSTPAVPVRQQPLLPPKVNVPRDDLPSDPQRVQVLHSNFRVRVPAEPPTVFGAGEVISVDNQPTTIRGIMTSQPAPFGSQLPALVNVTGDRTTASFDTVDWLGFTKRLQTPYAYTVTEAIPNVDVTDLRGAGTDYPKWLAPYLRLYEPGRTAAGYSTSKDSDIAALARSIVKAAGATTPYDEAKAIESWFLEKGRFSYTLTPPTAPAGVRPLDYFLFTSHRGYCQDFSTAMNVMLRTLGIPSRQLSGFGQGSFDEKSRFYVVNSLDAHSWVEVFFPGYGWIPFEPTPDGVNAPVNRPLTRAELNAPAGASAEATPRAPNFREPDTPETSSAEGSPISAILRRVMVVGGVALLLAVILMLIALRWLLAAKDLPRIWRRLLFLGDRLKVPRRPGDTPLEFGERLAGSVPPFDDEVRRLATLYTRGTYRRGGLTTDELAEARLAWNRIRRSYARLVAEAWRDALRQGRVVSAREAEESRSRVPSPRR